MREYSVRDTRSSDEIRSDATINRKALIEAARELFKTFGPEVTLAEIIRKAKVSRPTFYRNFKDKHDLIVSIFHFNLEILEAYAQEIGVKEQSFELLLKAIAKQEIEFHALIPFINKEEIELTERLQMIFEEHVTYQKSISRLRNDFNLETDLTMIILMIGAASLYKNDHEKEIAVNRACEFVMEGLRPSYT